jgi:ABC-type uncharacterized transport system auxiliary subunit
MMSLSHLFAVLQALDGPQKRMAQPALLISIALMVLSGCAGKTRYPTYYLLNLKAPAAASRPSKPAFGPVAVREFQAPSFLREGPIAYREPGDRLGLYEYHHWAVDPRRTVTEGFIRDMQSRGFFESVARYDGHGSPEYLLTGEILHLEEVDEGASVSIEVGLSARMINLQTGKLVWQDTTSQTAKLDQRSISGVVEEMSREMQTAVGGLVSSMENQLNHQLKAER